MPTKEEIKLKIKQQIRDEIAKKTPEKKSTSGFFSNLRQDIVDFGKGLVFIGRQVVTKPKESFSAVKDTGVELAKQTVKAIPGQIKNEWQLIRHPIQSFESLKDNINKLRSVSYEEQKNLLDDLSIQAIKKANESGDSGKKNLAIFGAGMLSDFVKEVSYPEEFSYERPFTFGLDVLSVGGGKLLGKSAKLAGQTKLGSEVIKATERIFVPNAKLKQAGFGEFGEAIQRLKTNMFNLQEKTIKGTAQTFEKTFKLNKQERFDFFESIDKLRRDATGVLAKSDNPKVQKAIDWWLKEEVPKLRQLTGLPEDKSITNYLHHFFPEKLKSADTTGKPFLFSKRGFLKKSEDITGYSKDPIVSISAIKIKAGLAVMKDAFIEQTVKKYSANMDELANKLSTQIGLDKVRELSQSGRLNEYIAKNFNLASYKPDGALRFFKVSDPKVTGVTSKVKEYFLPTEIVDELTKLSIKNVQNPVFNALDFFNRNWKPLATAVRPRYHTRNIVGNTYNGIILGKTSLKTLPIATKELLGGYINELKNGTGVASKIANKIWPKDINVKWLQEAIDEDVVGRGFFAMDLHDLAKVAENADDIVKAINKVKNPAEIYSVPVLRQWLQASMNVGQAIEDNARLALYIDRRLKGMTKAASKVEVDKYLFDYLNGLSETDKAIKKLVPFWSWTRFNVPLQSEQLVLQPVKHTVINKLGRPVINEVEKGDDTEKYLTDKEKNAGFIKVGEAEKNGTIYNKYIRTESVLPVSDLARILDLTDLRTLGVNPLIGLSQSLYANRNYFDNMIERFSGEERKFLNIPMRGNTIEILKIIPFLSEVNKLIGGSYINGEEPAFDELLEQVVSPLGTSLKNKEEMETFGLLEKEAKLKGSYNAGLESLYKQYIKKSQKNPDEKVFMNNVQKLEYLLKREGLTDLNLLQLKLKAIKEAIKEQVKDNIQKSIKEKQNEPTKN